MPLARSSLVKGGTMTEVTRFIEAPSSLTIQLKRFSYDGSAKKIETPIQGVFSFTLSPKFCIDADTAAAIKYNHSPKDEAMRGEEASTFAKKHLSKNGGGQDGTKYELTSFISHLGTSANSGHYVTYTREGNQWHCRNDGSVTPVSQAQAEKAASETGYILRYTQAKDERIDR